MARKNAPPVPEGLKWCFGCSAAKPLTAYHPDKRKPDGCGYRCRSCVADLREERKAIQMILLDAERRINSHCWYVPTQAFA